MEDPWVEDRLKMVETQIVSRGIKDERVIAAMKKVPRHLFVPPEMIDYAYNDEPVPIGEGQTISQPYIVAYMTEALHLQPEDRVLEIGTGSGYQTAILAELVKEVYTVEIIASLSLRAQEVLGKLGYRNIYFKIGDGTFGWEENSPYEAIMVTAAPARIPEQLEKQLKPGGRLVIPVGSTFQDLYLVTREKDGFKRKKLLPVRFVPLITIH
jgi:protein-L-isoaspartate(D-aspartate) O-methyltransferase